MTPGPTYILKTPVLGTLVQQRSIGSGNTFGATYWTDGWRDAPMLPDYSPLRVIPETGELFWREDCAEVDCVHWFRSTPPDPFDEPEEEKPDYSALNWAENPGAEDYRRALELGLGSTREREFSIRRRLWWAANDPMREQPVAQSLDAADLENRLRLLELADLTDPSDRLDAAELCRGLGNFAEAVRLLTFDFSPDFVPVANQIRQLAEAKDVLVRKLT